MPVLQDLPPGTGSKRGLLPFFTLPETDSCIILFKMFEFRRSRGAPQAFGEFSAAFPRPGNGAVPQAATGDVGGQRACFPPAHRHTGSHPFFSRRSVPSGRRVPDRSH